MFPDVYENIFCKNQSPCQVEDIVNHIVDVSHLLLCVNSSANFLIYLLGGEKFRRAWIDTYCHACPVLLRRRQRQQLLQARRSEDCATVAATAGGGPDATAAVTRLGKPGRPAASTQTTVLSMEATAAAGYRANGDGGNPVAKAAAAAAAADSKRCMGRRAAEAVRLLTEADVADAD